MEGKGGKEVILAGVQAGEPHSGDGYEPSSLRKHLDVAKRFEKRHVLARGRKDLGRGTGEECRQREPPARVPEIAGHEARAALRAEPQRAFRHGCKP